MTVHMVFSKLLMKYEGFSVFWTILSVAKVVRHLRMISSPIQHCWNLILRRLGMTTLLVSANLIKFSHFQNDAWVPTYMKIAVIMIHSHILCIQIFTLEVENLIQGPPGPQLKISSKEGWKKTYHIWKVRGGVLRVLTKKPTQCSCIPVAPLIWYVEIFFKTSQWGFNIGHTEWVRWQKYIYLSGI